MKKPRWLFILVPALLTLLVALFIVVEHIRGKWMLAKVKKEWVAQGEPFTLEELRPIFPENKNGFPSFIAAARRFSSAGPNLTALSPPTMKMVGPGKAMIGWQVEQWICKGEWFQGIALSGDEGSTNLHTWDMQGQKLEAIQDLLTTIREALQKPALNNPLDYSAGFTLMLPHLAPTKSAAQYLSASLLYRLHMGDRAGALQDMRALQQLDRVPQNEKLIISQLVRIAILSIAFNAAWEMLQKDGWSDAELEALQAFWSAREYPSGMMESIHMETAMLLDIVEQSHSVSTSDLVNRSFGGSIGAELYDDNSTISLLIEEVPYGDKVNQFVNTLPTQLWQLAWADQDAAHLLKATQPFMLAERDARQSGSMVQLLALCKTLSQTTDATGGYNRRRYMLALNTTRIWPNILKKSFRAEAMRRMLVTALALYRHRLKHGVWPETLSVLIPEFLERLPLDPMNGKELRYRGLDNGTFLLYSVGENGIDDNGTPSGTGQSTWLFSGPDWVWPRPASKKEILDYYTKQK